jgi:TPR repeat protein
MKRVVGSALLLVAMSGSAKAGLDESLEAARNGDYVGAAKALVEPVRDGFVAVLDTATPRLERGVATIEAVIGDAYYYGHGVSRDYTEAARMYQRAAAKGNAMAQSTLGDIYFYGRGLPQDFSEAIKWWSLAAENNVAIAQLNLGVMYANGDGVPQDYVKAHMYADLAAARLPPGEDRDTAVKNRDVVAKLMTPEQMAEAQRLAREWRPAR